MDAAQKVGDNRATISFFISSVGTFLIGRQEVVITPSPPLSIGVVGWLLAILKGACFVYNIQEFYPALALQMGLTTPGSVTYAVYTKRYVLPRQ
jgi:hypothetical protein